MQREYFCAVQPIRIPFSQSSQVPQGAKGFLKLTSITLPEYDNTRYQNSESAFGKRSLRIGILLNVSATCTFENASCPLVISSVEINVGKYTCISKRVRQRGATALKLGEEVQIEEFSGGRGICGRHLWVSLRTWSVLNIYPFPCKKNVDPCVARSHRYTKSSASNLTRFLSIRLHCLWRTKDKAWGVVLARAPCSAVVYP